MLMAQAEPSHTMSFSCLVSKPFYWSLTEHLSLSRRRKITLRLRMGWWGGKRHKSEQNELRAGTCTQAVQHLLPSTAADVLLHVQHLNLHHGKILRTRMHWTVANGCWNKWRTAKTKPQCLCKDIQTPMHPNIYVYISIGLFWYMELFLTLQDPLSKAQTIREVVVPCATPAEAGSACAGWQWIYARLIVLRLSKMCFFSYWKNIWGKIFCAGHSGSLIQVNTNSTFTWVLFT